LTGNRADKRRRSAVAEGAGERALLSFERQVGDVAGNGTGWGLGGEGVRKAATNGNARGDSCA
jgi:hypothetical protein